jgi:hypothetical protein
MRRKDLIIVETAEVGGSPHHYRNTLEGFEGHGMVY